MEYLIDFETFEKYFHHYWHENNQGVVVYYVDNDMLVFKFKWVWDFVLNIKPCDIKTYMKIAEGTEISEQQLLDNFIEKYFKTAIKVLPIQNSSNSQNDNNKNFDVLLTTTSKLYDVMEAVKNGKTTESKNN